MTDEQLVARAKVGDVDATNELVRRYEATVRWTASRYYLPAGGDTDDLLQEGMIGLAKAIRDFDPAAGFRFTTFAKICVERNVITAIKLATRKKHLTLSTAMTGPVRIAADEDELDILDTFASANSDPAELLDDRDRARLILDVVRYDLSDVERACIVGRANGESYERISRRVDEISWTAPIGRASRATKTIDNALQRARWKIERRLREDGRLPLGAAA